MHNIMAQGGVFLRFVLEFCKFIIEQVAYLRLFSYCGSLTSGEGRAFSQLKGLSDMNFIIINGAEQLNSSRCFEWQH